MNEPWNRSDTFAVAMVIIAIVGTVAALLVVPEVRRFSHLDNPSVHEEKPVSTAQPGPAQDSAPKSTTSKLDLSQHSTTKVRGNSNVAGNNTKGDYNVVGDDNQTGPTANAPNGIAITGGTVSNPTVNNYIPPKRRLSDEDSASLRSCLAAKTGTFTIEAIANNGEAYQFAKDFSDAFANAGWKNEQPIPVAIFMIGGGMWTGVRISIHGDWDEATKTATLIEGSPEQTAFACLRKIQFGATAIPYKTMATGSILIAVSEPR